MLADLMGCDPFVMSVCGSVAGGITLSENQGREEKQRQKT